MFLDRDGVINEDHGYVSSSENFIFNDGVINFLRKAQTQYNYQFIIITNQSGIGRGYFTEKDFKKLMKWLEIELLNRGIKILDIYYCPYHPKHGIGKYKKESEDRKPEPGMILKAAEKYKINLKEAVLIGDNMSDINAGLKANIGNIFLLSNEKDCENSEVNNDFTLVNNFKKILRYI